MSLCIDTYVFECSDCNYEVTAKSVKLQQMFQRLHYKKCKATGRTEKAVLTDQARQTQKIWSQNIRVTSAKDLCEMIERDGKQIKQVISKTRHSET